MNSHHEHNQSDEPGFWRSRTGVAFIIIGSVAGYFLVTEHWAHFMGALPMYSCMVDMVITTKTAIMVVMKKNKIYKRAHPTKMINLIKENPYE